MSDLPTDIIGGAPDVPATDAAATAETVDSGVPAAAADGVPADAKQPESAAQKDDAPKAEESVPAVPEAYAEFTMPEGVEFSADVKARAEPLFKALKLTQEQAQQAAEFLATERSVHEKTQADEYVAYVTGLADASKADKEIGGEKLAENAGHAKQFIEKFGRGEKGAEVFKVLTETGMGNHPAIIALLAKAHKAMSEDSPSGGQPASQAPASVESRLFPTMNK